MAYSTKEASSAGVRKGSSERTAGGLATKSWVRKEIKNKQQNPDGNKFYELELAEVIEVYRTEEQLPDIEKTGEKNWGSLGSIIARKIVSEKDKNIDNLRPIQPLEHLAHTYPIRGEIAVVVEYLGQSYWTNILNKTNGVVNWNPSPGQSGGRPSELTDVDGIFENFDPGEYGLLIKRLWPYQGDNIIQGRWGNSIRFGSNIVPDSHEDSESTQHSPNILIRAGQLTDAELFDKTEYLEELKKSPFKPVKEDINADGSSIWITTDQSVKLNIEGTNAKNHDFMTAKQEDKQPKDGGKQIVLNTDRITFNAKDDRILGFAKSGIGFSTQKSFSVDADEGFDMNVGGGPGGPGSTFSMSDSNLIMTSPTNAGLNVGSDRAVLSSPCPSILTLADYANITACKGAILHLDDCAGIKDNQGSFLRVGGKAQGVTGYVFGREDMGQQHLVYGEELTNILDSICNSFVELGETILNLAAIPTGAGPSGPISGGPANTPAIEAWKAGVETIRARLCDLLMKPEDDEIPSI